jgi:hypothetical protein
MYEYLCTREQANEITEDLRHFDVPFAGTDCHDGQIKIHYSNVEAFNVATADYRIKSLGIFVYKYTGPTEGNSLSPPRLVGDNFVWFAWPIGVPARKFPCSKTALAYAKDLIEKNLDLRVRLVVMYWDHIDDVEFMTQIGSWIMERDNFGL